jgi:CRISPR-associated protein Cas5t
MRVLRVSIEAPITSFRHPHFLIGRQLTYEMPPPSTIYGHVMSAVGELWPPKSIEFGYHFKFKAKARDLEHQHILSRKAGKTKVSYDITVQPHQRDFLFDCSLTLYLKSERLEELRNAFRQPVFCVNLGRSQDLASIRRVEEIELAVADSCYLESTLLPFESMRLRTGRGITAVMPKYIGPPPLRDPLFERYVVLQQRIFAGPLAQIPSIAEVDRMLKRADAADSDAWLVDASTGDDRGMRRGVVFHGFV